MTERVRALIPIDLSRLWSGTFHSIANRILRQHADYMGYTPAFTIMDSDDRKSMIKNFVKTLKLDENPPASRSRKCSHPFSAWRTMKAPAFRKRWKTPIPTSPTIWTPFWTCMNSTSSASRKPTAWTLTTCCSTSMRLFQEQEHLRALYGARFHHILVDEYQDTNYLQSRFIDMLARRHGQLMVVGDDAQSIYSWRGADMENILSFTTRYRRRKPSR